MQASEIIERLHSVLTNSGGDFDGFHHRLKDSGNRALVQSLKRWDKTPSLRVRRDALTRLADELARQQGGTANEKLRELGLDIIKPDLEPALEFRAIKDPFRKNKTMNGQKIRIFLENDNTAKFYVYSLYPNASYDNRDECQLVINDLIFENRGQDIQFVFGKNFRPALFSRQKNMSKSAYPSYSGYASLFDKNLYAVGCCIEFEEYLPISIYLHNINPRLNTFCGTMSGPMNFNDSIYTKKICMIKTKEFSDDVLGIHKTEEQHEEIYNWLSRGSTFSKFDPPHPKFLQHQRL